MPTLAKAKNRKDTVVYFGDAVHLIYGADLGYSWCIEREQVKSSYGRKRFNIMGALDSESHEVVTVSNDTYITSIEVDELFSKLRAKNPQKRIFIFLDNASYQKSELVRLSSKKYKINIIYLPTYSPNLNLIERLWKFLRKSCLCNRYFMTFKLFTDSLLCCLQMTHKEYFFVLETFLAHNFEALGFSQ
jgi:transposase